MRVYIMTDMEGVAGNLNFEDWCARTGRYYEMGKEFLTGEVSAAAEGFFAGGAKEVVVADGHGNGGINPKLLDPRAELMRGWPGGWPVGLDETYDAIAWIGQHAKAGSEYAHLAHTQSFWYIDLSVNGVSIGELGQLALCASQLGVPAIFASGDEALTKEAEALVPGIETVAVKRGTTPGRGDELDSDAYAKRNCAAIHLSPERARAKIRKGARRAIERFRKSKARFGLIELTPPFERVGRFRSKDGRPEQVARETHPSDVIALMNMPFDMKPLRKGRPKAKKATRRKSSARR